MADKPTVFLVDDDENVRDALQWLLESIDLDVETFASGSEFLDRFDPECAGCLIVDVRMPGMSGLELQQRLADRDSLLPVIVITGHGDVPVCVRAFEGGAFAFLEKPVNHQELLEYVNRAMEENQRARQNRSTASHDLSRVQLLTDREREVMDLLVAGKSLKQISIILGISVPTSSKHRARVLDKLQVQNDVELVRLVLSAQQ